MRKTIRKEIYHLVYISFLFASCISNGLEIDSLQREVVSYNKIENELKDSMKSVFTNYFKMLNEYNDSVYFQKIYDVQGKKNIIYDFEIYGGLFPGTESFYWNDIRYFRKVNSKVKMNDPFFIYKDYLYTLNDHEMKVKNLKQIEKAFFFKIKL